MVAGRSRVGPASVAGVGFVLLIFLVLVANLALCAWVLYVSASNIINSGLTFWNVFGVVIATVNLVWMSRGAPPQK